MDALRELDFGPEDLPTVSPREVEHALEAATVGAEEELAGVLIGVRFRRRMGPETRVMFTDGDARCWAVALDRLYGLDTRHGAALCFRLLALLDILSRETWLRPLFSVGEGEGLDLHPSLLKAAAGAPLTPDGRFESEDFRRRLSAVAGFRPRGALRSIGGR